LVRWKGYLAEEDSWEREANLKNAKEVVDEYEKEYDREGRRIKEEHRKIPRRFTAKLLYGWDNQKFNWEYLKKLERNWKKWKRAKFFQRKNLKKEGNIINLLRPKIIQLERWKKWNLFSDKLDKGC